VGRASPITPTPTGAECVLLLPLALDHQYLRVRRDVEIGESLIDDAARGRPVGVENSDLLRVRSLTRGDDVGYQPFGLASGAPARAVVRKR
jgi:hypothetical protein